MNYGDLQQAVANRLNRPDLLTLVPPATQPVIAAFVQDRILYYQKAAYAPAEQLDYSITCVPSQNTYLLPAGTQAVNYCRLLLSNIWLPLTRADWLTDVLAVDLINPPFVTLPSYYVTIGQSLRLYPAPSAAYPLELLVYAAPPAPAATTDTNFWTNEAQTLIIESACADILNLVVKDDTAAARHYLATAREERSLLEYTQRLHGPSRIRPHL